MSGNIWNPVGRAWYMLAAYRRWQNGDYARVLAKNGDFVSEWNC